MAFELSAGRTQHGGNMGGKHEEAVSGLVKNTGVVFHSRTADAPDKAALSKRSSGCSGCWSNFVCGHNSKSINKYFRYPFGDR